MKSRKKSKTLKKAKSPPIVPDTSHVFDNYEAASASSGISVACLKVSKGKGAPGFRGTRIYMLEFLPWWNANSAAVIAEAAKFETKREADARVARARADRLEFDNAVRRKLFISLDEVKRINTRAIVACKSKLLSIPSSIAPRLAVLTDQTECGTVVKKEIVDALTELSKMEFNK